jgi:hypothetical protein
MDECAPSSPLKNAAMSPLCATACSQAVLFNMFTATLLLAKQWHTPFSIRC